MLVSSDVTRGTTQETSTEKSIKFGNEHQNEVYYSSTKKALKKKLMRAVTKALPTK